MMATTRIGTTVSAPAVLGGGPFGHPYYVAFAAGGGYGGGPVNLQINVSRGNDLEHPTVMPEWSGDAVALAWEKGPSGSSISLAWTGNDPAHRLNYASSWDGVSFPKTETSNDTALGGPALARYRHGNMIAWTGGGGLGGGPADGHVNVLEPGRQRVVLPWKSISAPALAGDPGMFSPNRLYVAWTDGAGFIYVTYCTYDNLDELKDAGRLRRIETGGGPERTFTSPSLAFSGNQLFLSWAGSDAAHHVNFKVLEGVRAGQKVTLGETASSAIAMQTTDDVSYGWEGRYAYRGTDGVGGVYVTDGMPL